MKKIKMTETDYLNQYLLGWKEATEDIFVGDEIMKSFLELKKNQFCLKSYKKSLKLKDRLELALKQVVKDESDFFQDL